MRKQERSGVMAVDNVLGINDCQHMLVENHGQKRYQLSSVFVSQNEEENNLRVRAV